MELIDLTTAHCVVVKNAHSPAKRTLLCSELSVVLCLSTCDKQAVMSLGVDAGRFVFQLGERLRDGLALFAKDVSFTAGRCRLNNVKVLWLLLAWNREISSVLLIVLIVLDDGVVGDASLLCIRRRLASVQSRALPDIPKSEGVIFLDDLGVDVWDEEQARKDEQAETNTKSNSDDVPGRLLVELEVRGSLVDNRQRANGSGNQEEEGRSENSPLDGVLASVNNLIDVSKLHLARVIQGY